MKTFLTRLVTFLLVLTLTACGGGSSGTELGGSGSNTRFAGVIVSPDGTTLANTQVTLLDTDEVTLTDEGGAFELESEFVAGQATFEIESADGSNALVSVEDPLSNPNRVDVSILFDETKDSAELLDLTLRAKIVRSCSPLFLNTRTIRQTSPVIEGFRCVIEAEFKRNGLPENDLVFELQHKGCSDNDPWLFTGVSVTGSSGPGIGEIEFPFRNDAQHCVYRIVGPQDDSGTIPISAQVITLRKEQFDRGL